jgi:hypothetical protein
LALVAALLAGVAQATMVRTASLGDLVHQADRVVLGRCVEVRDTPRGAGGLPTTTVTVAVGEMLKGSAERYVTFTQLAMLGPRYAVGEEVLLFLAPPGRSGLAAPVGLAQGKLTIARRRSAGRPDVAVQAEAGRGGLGDGTALHTALADGSVELERLLATVRTMVREVR